MRRWSSIRCAPSKPSGVRPRRTMRFILFSGEEQGMFGSLAYVRAHRKELDNVVAEVVLDAGDGAITGFSTGGRKDIDAALAPLTATVRRLEGDGDHQRCRARHRQLRLHDRRRAHHPAQSGDVRITSSTITPPPTPLTKSTSRNSRRTKPSPPSSCGAGQPAAAAGAALHAQTDRSDLPGNASRRRDERASASGISGWTAAAGERNRGSVAAHRNVRFRLATW